MGTPILNRADTKTYAPLGPTPTEMAWRYDAEMGSRKLLNALLRYNDRLQREKGR